MTEAQALEAMLEFWEAQWDALHPAGPNDPNYIQVVYDNEAASSADTWARVTVVEMLRQQTTSGPRGSRREEVRGRIAIQLFTVVDEGALDLATLSDAVRTALRGQTITVGAQEIALFEVAPVGAATTDGRWFMRTLSCGYLYTETF